jgi:lipoyl(octanoyl) transferase
MARAYYIVKLNGAIPDEKKSRMNLQSSHSPVLPASSLQAYLLGSVGFESALAFQRRLLYQVAGERDHGAILLCEHMPLITVGRHGSSAHILYEPGELRARRWQVRWVNRGGGCVLHLPGQLVIYPILALDRLGLDLRTYMARLKTILGTVLGEFDVRAEARDNEIVVGGRRIATIGVAVRQWVSYYGAILNVNPDLLPFRGIRSSSAYPEVTSLARERRGALRPSLVRERLLEHFAASFQFSRTAVFFDHPSLSPKTPADAIAASS